MRHILHSLPHFLSLCVTSYEMGHLGNWNTRSYLTAAFLTAYPTTVSMVTDHLHSTMWSVSTCIIPYPLSWFRIYNNNVHATKNIASGLAITTSETITCSTMLHNNKVSSYSSHIHHCFYAAALNYRYRLVCHNSTTDCLTDTYVYMWSCTLTPAGIYIHQRPHLSRGGLWSHGRSGHCAGFLLYQVYRLMSLQYKQ